jgi:HAD superfamily hydrolase (TIGR01509 family)
MTSVIFDFNGTLYADSDKQEAAWQQIVKQEFNRAITPAEFAEYVHGRNNVVTLNHFAGRQLTPQEVRHYSDVKESIYRDLCQQDAATFHILPAAVRLLNELKTAGVPMTIATASEWENVAFFIHHFRLDQWFDPQRIVYNDGTIPGKPEPDFYLHAAAALHESPENCIVFEDAVSGVVAAQRAGIGTVVAIVPPDQKDQFDQMSEADVIITNFDDFDRTLISQLLLK